MIPFSFGAFFEISIITNWYEVLLKSSLYNAFAIVTSVLV